MPSQIRDKWEYLGSWALDSEGSSRPAGLLRIGLALLLWARFGSDVAFLHHPDPARIALGLVFTGTTILMLAGLWTRFSTLAAGAVIGSLYLYGAISPHKSGLDAHHVYLLFIATFLCALMPSGRSYSLDRWLAIRGGSGTGPPPERGNQWAVKLVMIQVGLIYFWSAIAKTQPGYFNGARMEQMFMEMYFGSQYPAWLPGFHIMCILLSWMIVLTEYALAVGLFVRRLLPWLIAIGTLFHIALYMVLPVETFSMTMILLYICFLDPDRVHGWIDEIQAPVQEKSRQLRTSA